ncbi:WD40 repeat-like protein [Rhizopogon vinicolor AM-OR11-026]|uniref:WD40 repeat-like protein n=1 Tax=Rhizopogon vinicolor AM-OR11-026 TaxID=1314800 RepID=A0A1B7MYB1_9AGAM|nr:WD40 repeat-like protein [Rhizopogon vinicolor AM-OR11-026]
MAEVAQPILRVTAPRRPFKDHENTVLAVAVFPDGYRMVTGSIDKTLRLWNLKDGVVLKKMEGHQSTVKAVAVSRDGKLIASGDENGQLIAWNGDTGESLTEAVKVHSTWIRSLDFSPDGTELASGSWDKTTELWCTKTWQVQGNPIICGGEVNCVRYSPSGEFLAIASTDLIIYNPRTKERIATLKTTASPCAFALTWTPNGARLLSASTISDPNIREWDSSTWKQVGDPWTGHSDTIHAIAVNRTGTLIASACKDNHTRLWRPSDRRTIAIFKDTHEVCCVTFSTDGTNILSGGRNMMIKEWAIPESALLESPPEEEARDSNSKAPAESSLPSLSTPQISIATAETSQAFTRITTPVRAYKDHKETVHAVAVFPDGRRMVTGSYDNMVHIWDLKDGVLLKKMEGHSGWVWAVAVSRDGKLVASGDDNGTLIVWHGDTGEILIPAVKAHAGRIRSMNFSPDGALLATGSTDKTTELWSTDTWKAQGNPINCGGIIYCVRFSPSGEHLAISTDGDKDILIYNAHTRECITNLKAASSPSSLAWMPDGTRLLSGGPLADPTIREWDTSTWKQVGEAWMGHAHCINVLAVNPNATFIVSGSDDNLMRLWRLSDRQTIAIFKDTHEVYCGVFSTDGKRILAGGRNMMIREWALPENTLRDDIPKEQAASSIQLRLTPSTSIATAEAMQVIPRFATPHRAFKDHKNTVFAVAIFPDGDRMVTTSMDQTLLLWNLKDGTVLKKMEGHQSTVRAVAVSADGQLIASGDENGALIAWHGVTGESLTDAIKVHTTWIRSLDFSPDGTALASGSWDKTTELWCTKTWQVPGNPINCGGEVNCVRYSPSGEFLAIAGSDILICNSRTSECIATLKTATSPWAYALEWTPDGTRLFSGGTNSDPNIREWDTSTWKQIGDHWSGHTDYIYAIAVDPTGTLVASACKDNHVRLWRASDRRTIAIYKDPYEVYCAIFSKDGKHILSGGRTMMVKEWEVPEDALLDAPKVQVSEDALPKDAPEEQATDKHASSEDASGEQVTSKHTSSEEFQEHHRDATDEHTLWEDVLEEQATSEHALSSCTCNHGVKAQDPHSKILSISTTALSACITGDLPLAEDVLTQEIGDDADNYNSYANRSFVMARKSDWDRALHDALKVRFS